MHSSGRALADVFPAAAGDTIFGQPVRAATQSTGSGRDRCPDAGDATAHPSRTLLCRVDRLTELTHDIRELRLVIESGGPFEFSAGQFVCIEFAPGLSRYYSLASTPAEQQLVFQLRGAPEGEGSAYVRQRLRRGDKLKVSGPLGSSYLRERHAGPVLLVAGGSGLAPMLSILRTLLARDRGARVLLYFGVRSECDVYHERLLAGLAADHGNFCYHIVLSAPGCESGRRQGLVHEAVAADLADVSGYTAYLAGPPSMVEAAGALLLGRGIATCDIHADAFRNRPSAW